MGSDAHAFAGTGKTSLIAAICNLMQYSCYDLDLSGVQSNGELRSLLAQTSNRCSFLCRVRESDVELL